MPKEGLSEAVVWGSFVTSGERPGPSSLERKTYKIYNSTQVCCWILLYIQQLFLVQSKHLEGLVEGGLDCIGEFRQGGQIVSRMATSEAVAPWGGAGRGGGTLGPEHRGKSALLFSSRWERWERQEGGWGARAARDGRTGGHYCGTETIQQELRLSITKWFLSTHPVSYCNLIMLQ